MNPDESEKLSHIDEGIVEEGIFNLFNKFFHLFLFISLQIQA